MELFVFTDNWVFKSMFYKGTWIFFSFETVLIPHNIQMDERLIVHGVHISGTRVAEAVIDGISRGNNFGVIMRGINPLKFNSLQLGDLEMPAELKRFIKSWWEPGL